MKKLIKKAILDVLKPQSNKNAMVRHIKLRVYNGY